MDFNTVWAQIAPYLGGVSLAGVISCIVYAVLRAGFSKALGKINVEKISNEATEKGIAKLKDVSFKHSIQPLVESRMKDIEEKVAARYEQALADTEAKYQQLIEIMDKFAAYFDNSIGVMEEDKKALHEAIQSAKTEPTTVESTVVEESIETTANTSVLPDNAVKTVSQVNVVR